MEGGGRVATVQVAARDNAAFHISENNQDDIKKYCCLAKYDGLPENNEYCCHHCNDDGKGYLSSK